MKTALTRLWLSLLFVSTAPAEILEHIDTLVESENWEEVTRAAADLDGDARHELFSGMHTRLGQRLGMGDENTSLDIGLASWLISREDVPPATINRALRILMKHKHSREMVRRNAEGWEELGYRAMARMVLDTSHNVFPKDRIQRWVDIDPGPGELSALLDLMRFHQCDHFANPIRLALLRDNPAAEITPHDLVDAARKSGDIGEAARLWIRFADNTEEMHEHRLEILEYLMKRARGVLPEDRRQDLTRDLVAAAPPPNPFLRYYPGVFLQRALWPDYIFYAVLEAADRGDVEAVTERLGHIMDTMGRHPGEFDSLLVNTTNHLLQHPNAESMVGPTHTLFTKGRTTFPDDPDLDLAHTRVMESRGDLAGILSIARRRLPQPELDDSLRVGFARTLIGIATRQKREAEMLNALNDMTLPQNNLHQALVVARLYGGLGDTERMRKVFEAWKDRSTGGQGEYMLAVMTEVYHQRGDWRNVVDTARRMDQTKQTDLGLNIREFNAFVQVLAAHALAKSNQEEEASVFFWEAVVQRQELMNPDSLARYAGRLDLLPEIPGVLPKLGEYAARVKHPPPRGELPGKTEKGSLEILARMIRPETDAELRRTTLRQIGSPEAVIAVLEHHRNNIDPSKAVSETGQYSLFLEAVEVYRDSPSAFHDFRAGFRTNSRMDKMDLLEQELAYAESYRDTLTPKYKTYLGKLGKSLKAEDLTGPYTRE